MYHVQCVLNKKNIYQISWIHEKYAVMGKWIKLKENGVWEDRWQVMDCGARELTEKIKKRENDYKRMKLVTDI
jgi:hypothetical protein